MEKPGQLIHRENASMKANGARIRKINRVDRQMVSLLQKDGRMPIVAIAKELGISETTARSRLKRLLADDVIKVVAVSNPIQLGIRNHRKHQAEAST
jgi:Lrp/AsnC family transcriptional regulator for asnA, asnC and gidA